MTANNNANNNFRVRKQNTSKNINSTLHYDFNINHNNEY